MNRDNLRIGTCSWKYDSWHGLVYSDQKSLNYLQEYSQQYNTVEIDQWFWSLFGPEKISLPSAFTVQEYLESVIAHPDILVFHLEVLRSLESYGRAHKLGIMLRHKLTTRHWLKDLDLGLKMFSRRKLELFPSRVKAAAEINRLFVPHWKVRST